MSYYDNPMSDSAKFRSGHLEAELGYIRTGPPSSRPGILRPVLDGRLYEFRLDMAHSAQWRDPGRHRPAEHVHDVYHIIQYRSRDNRFRIDGEIIEACPGLVVFTSPGEPHEFTPMDLGGTLYDELTFSFHAGDQPLRWSMETLLEHLTGMQMGSLTSPSRISTRRQIRWRRIVRKIVRAALSARPEDWWRIERDVLDLLLDLARKGQSVSAREPAAEDRLEQVRRWIQMHYPEALRVEDLARRAHYSEAHFSRLFRNRFGRSPIAYQQLLRIEAAKNLLRSSNVLCKEIAARLGFADAYCFSKAFTKQEGCSPAAYRRRIRRRP